MSKINRNSAVEGPTPPSRDELRKFFMLKLDDVGLLSEMIKQDSTGELAVLVTEGGLDFAKHRLIEKMELEAFTPRVRSSHLSFFERQIGYSLEKSYDSYGHANLNENANRTTSSSGQRPNKNATMGAGGVAEMFGADPRNVAEKSINEGDLGRCARFCKMQGRTQCPVCHGIGHEAYAKQRADKAVGVNSNRSRTLFAGQE